MVLGNLSNAVRIYQSLVSETNLEVKKGGPEILILGGVGVFIVQFSRRVFFFITFVLVWNNNKKSFIHFEVYEEDA